MIKRSVVSLIIALSLIVSATLTSYAQPAVYSGGNGLKISPVRTDLTLSPGSTQTVNIYVQNVTTTPAVLRAIVNDFTASSDESGRPDIILNDNQYAPTHSLKQFVAPIANISLQPNEQKSVPVTINIPATAVAGGYYGAVRFAPASANTNKNVTLTASVGSLILVRITGKVKEQLAIASFDVRQKDRTRVIFTSNKSLQLVVRFQNSGDVQEEPFGKILLKKGSQVLDNYEINNTNPRGNVLPGSIRRFTQNLTHVGSFGKYSLEGNFGYGENGQLLSATTSFYVIPLTAILVTLIVILLILFVVFLLPRLIRNYNQRIIRNSRRNNP